MNKKIIFSAVLSLGALSLAAQTGHAWTGGVPDPNSSQQEIQGKTDGVVPAEGVFKKWDPNDPDPGPNPIDPKYWVDVEVPAKILFGQTDATNNQIISPLYKVKNLSKKGVKIMINEVKPGLHADELKELTLNARVHGKEYPLVDPKNPTQPVMLADLKNKDEEATFTLTGNAGPNFQFDKTIKPEYEFLLSFQATN
ncbi:hypothetical protein [Enterococcus sp. CSURQ0835]|uniref:hypothetical protein n=1 Tax=Enterococcus sp. CSURQ0835 TaxID=2681394 RepID=UPI00135BC7B0|nr:hypothetical protein [Enterococcus sp. CSURQ0835]